MVPAVRALGEATRYASEDATHLGTRIDRALQGHAPSLSKQSTLQRQVQHFSAVNHRAQAYSRAEQWSRAVDTVLTAAVGRLVAWGEGNIDAFDQSQHQRLSILIPTRSGGGR